MAHIIVALTDTMCSGEKYKYCVTCTTTQTDAFNLDQTDHNIILGLFEKFFKTDFISY